MEKKTNGNGNGRQPWTDDEVEILKKRKHELYGTMSVKKMWKTGKRFTIIFLTGLQDL